jgi:hypothetical protein
MEAQISISTYLFANVILAGRGRQRGIGQLDDALAESFHALQAHSTMVSQERPGRVLPVTTTRRGSAVIESNAVGIAVIRCPDRWRVA